MKYRVHKATIKFPDNTVELPDGFIVVSAFETTEPSEEGQFYEIVRKIVYLLPLIEDE